MDDKYVLHDPGNLKAALSQTVAGETIFVRLDLREGAKYCYGISWT